MSGFLAYEYQTCKLEFQRYVFLMLMLICHVFLFQKLELFLVNKEDVGMEITDVDMEIMDVGMEITDVGAEIMVVGMKTMDVGMEIMDVDVIQSLALDQLDHVSVFKIIED